MGILDEAIRDHLELKRQHGAGDSELKQLEDEAFGPPERPGGEAVAHDPFAEAPTEFMAAPEVDGQAVEAAAEPVQGADDERLARRESPGIADLQEPPPSIEPADGKPLPAEPEEQAEPSDPEPAAEEQAATEHEIVPEAPQPPAGPTTEERHAIAEQPTELFDIEEEIAASDSAAPSDEELVEEEIGEPRLAPVDPLAGLEEADAEGEVEVSAAFEDEDDFFDEQRLSDELDQALEAPVEEAPEVRSPAEIEDEEADEEGDVESLAVEDEDEGAPGTAPAESGGVFDRDREDDVLEDTPDFLEDSEDVELWFEQKPPKDFDFDD
jgi:hypothetical protein